MIQWPTPVDFRLQLFYSGLMRNVLVFWGGLLLLILLGLSAWFWFFVNIKLEIKSDNSDFTVFKSPLGSFYFLEFVKNKYRVFSVDGGIYDARMGSKVVPGKLVFEFDQVAEPEVALLYGGDEETVTVGYTLKNISSKEAVISMFVDKELLKSQKPREVITYSMLLALQRAVNDQAIYPFEEKIKMAEALKYVKSNKKLLPVAVVVGNLKSSGLWNFVWDLFSPPEVKAACSGTVGCGNWITDCECGIGSGIWCSDEGEPCESNGNTCICNPHCVGEIGVDCGGQSQGSCSAEGLCGVGKCIESGSCSWSGPPPTATPTPTPGPEPTSPPVACEGCGCGPGGNRTSCVPNPVCGAEMACCDARPECVSPGGGGGNKHMSISALPQVCAGDTVTTTMTINDEGSFQFGVKVRGPISAGNGCDLQFWWSSSSNCTVIPPGTRYHGGGPTSPMTRTDSFTTTVRGNYRVFWLEEECDSCGWDEDADVTVRAIDCPVSAWWQVKDADITTNGNISSKIPSGCTLPGCNPVFGLDGLGGFPGVVAYGGDSFSFSGTISSGANQVSSKNWLANTSYLGKTYGYAYFSQLLPKVDCNDDPTALCYNSIILPSINGGDLNSGGAAHRGYVWYKRVGDLAINGNVNLVGDRKVVLLVEGGDLTVNGRVNLQSPGVGFFMTIVGKDVNGQKGNIIVDPSVTHPTEPGLEGIYLSDAQFRTGAGSSKLWVKGAVVAYGGVQFQRDLGGGNTTAPAELFEYNPSLIFTYPRELTRKNMTWREVAP